MAEAAETMEDMDDLEVDDGVVDQDFGAEDVDIGMANSDDEEGERVDFKDLPPHEQVRRLFPVVFRSQWGDISAEDKQPVVFEASSLVSTVLDNHLVQWENGIQVPLLVYITENLIRRLKRNGWSIMVVFFGSFAAKAWPSAAHELAAKVIEHHLRHVLSRTLYNEDVGACSLSEDPVVSVHDFPSWRHKSWTKFLHDVHPGFVVVAPPTAAERRAERAGELTDTNACTISDLKCLFIMDLLHGRVRCVTSDFNFTDLRVATFSLLETGRLEYYKPADFEALIVAPRSNGGAARDAADTASVVEKLPGGTESVRYAADAVVRLLRAAPEDAAYCKCYLVHVVMLRQLRLRDRVVRDEAIAAYPGRSDALLFMQRLIRVMCLCVPDPATAAPGSAHVRELDLMDGRLFLALLAVLGGDSPPAVESSAALGLDTSALVDSIGDVWAACADMAGITGADAALFPLTAPQHSGVPSGAGGDAAATSSAEEAGAREERPFVYTKCPFAAELVKDVDEELDGRGCLSKEKAQVKALPMLTPVPDKEYRYKHENPLTEERQMKAVAMNGRQMRAHMKQYAFMKKFAATLSSKLLVTNIVTARSDGRGLAPASAEDEEEEEEEEEEQQKGGKKGGKKGAKKGAAKKGQRGGKGQKGASRKEEIIRQNKLRLSQADVDKVTIAIDTASKEREIEDRIQRLADRLRALRKIGATPMALVNGYITLISWCLQQWETEREDARLSHRTDVDYTAAINAFRLTYDVLDFFAKDTEPEQMRDLQKFMCQLGFKAAARELYKRYVALKGAEVRKEARFDPRKEIFENLDLGMSFQRFQMNYTGHLMQRSFDSKDDDRVGGFQPDAWQRVLMDTVDQKHSALVVAPTSSGKTFVSYYTMKQVLEDNKFKQQPRSRRRKDAVKQEKDTKYGIVVYICPTKALVNQVAAEVYHRYGAVVGVLTRDYAQSINNCQVLVTVPSMLESILLTPTWVRLLRYVILDEVHCIQGNNVSLDAETGSTWEHVIDMLPCPFVALSATIGNPDRFHSWLAQTQRSQGREVRLIVHPHRWGDLKLSVYAPPVGDESDKKRRLKFTATNTKPKTPGLRPLHPFSCVSVSDIVHVGALEVLSMSPDECVVLFDALSSQCAALREWGERSADAKARYEAVCEVLPADELKALNPDKYFKDSQVILRYDVYVYEEKLKATVKRLCCSGPAGARLFEDVISRLANERPAEEADDDDDEEEGGAGERVEYPCGVKFTEEYMMPLLVELMSKKQLPALLFSLNRHMCTRMACQVIRALVAKEAEDRQRPEFQKQLKEIERINKRLEKDAKRKRDKDEEAGAKDPFQAEEPGMLTMPDEGPDPRFSFIPPGKRMYGEDRDYWENRIRWKVNCSEPLMATLMQGLDRGVGVHHAGLPHAYRLAVEVLFRAGHLQVLFATGTLAMGINMPARTVCFFDDSAALTPLLYRQMSGRAGRRGYDDVGHVVFCSLPKHRVHSIVSSKLTTLTGYQPISPTLALRTLISYSENDSTQRQEVASFFAGLLQPALFTNNIVEEERRQLYSRHLRVLFRVYLEFLRRMRFVDEDLDPIGLGSMAAALHAEEPANFSFCYLLAAGHIDRVCSTFRQDNEGTARRLLHMLCHVFNHVPVPEGMRAPESFDENTAQVVLDPLPPAVDAGLREYGVRVLSTFEACAEASAHSAPSDADEKLPVSGSTFSEGTAVAGAEGASLAAEVVRCGGGGDGGAPAVLSPFAALSGRRTVYDSPSAFADTARPGLLADAGQVPLSMLTDASGRRFRLNAAALDYYRLVSKQKMVRENGFKEEVAWELLRSWNMLISAIKTNLKTMVTHPLANLTLQTFEYLSEEFQKKFDRFNEIKS
eukprot:TRINITY_DN1745_c0_g2_i2.p1 TRINITY_DN1745_c0_g2~~TRINITY_DN1745_c0_g2_i2.p1  ORF type:complete len:1860 (+),score=903.65 TRINITY_DN1745_c0_g2_i2:199-5778(+)